MMNTQIPQSFCGSHPFQFSTCALAALRRLTRIPARARASASTSASASARASARAGACAAIAALLLGLAPAASAQTNTQPTAVPAFQRTSDTQALSFEAADFGFRDADSGQTLSAVVIDTLPHPGHGTLTLLDDKGTTVTTDDTTTTITTTLIGATGYSILVANIDGLRYNPADRTARYTASFRYRVVDSSGASDDTQISAAATMSIAVSNGSLGLPTVSFTNKAGEGCPPSANPPSSGTGGKSTSMYVEADIVGESRLFYFRNHAASGGASVTLRLWVEESGSRLPPAQEGAQTLTLAADTCGRHIVTHPGAHGRGYSTVTVTILPNSNSSTGYQVSGPVSHSVALGSGNSGEGNNNMRTRSVFNAPTVAPVNMTASQSQVTAFKTSDFGFRDADPQDSLKEITITALPNSSHGTLMHGATPAATAVNAVIAAEDIGTLTFTPASSSASNTATFTFTATDTSGHASLATSDPATMRIVIGATLPVVTIDSVATDGAGDDLNFTLRRTGGDMTQTLVAYAGVEQGFITSIEVEFDANAATGTGFQNYGGSTGTGLRPGAVLRLFVMSPDDPAILGTPGMYALGTGTARERTITIPANLPPRVKTNPPTFPDLHPGEAFSFDLSSYFEDPEGETLTFTKSLNGCPNPASRLVTTSGTNLVGGDSGAVPSDAALNTMPPCIIVVSDGYVPNNLEHSFTLNITAAPVVMPAKPTINFKANGFPTSLTRGQDVTVTFTRTGDDSASLVMGYQLNVGSKASTKKLTFAENSDEVELALDWDDDIAAGAGGNLAVSILPSDDFALSFTPPFPGDYTVGTPNIMTVAIPAAPAANTKPTAVDDSFGISSTHTRTVTLSGNVITGVAGTGLTTEGGATDIMLGADMDDGGVSNLRVTFVSAALSDGSLDPDGAQTPGSTGTTVTLTSGQGSLTINETGAFTYTPPTGDFEFFFGVSPNRAKRAIAAGETGTISVAYRIADMASPALDDDGVLTITVTAPPAAGPNTPPTLAVTNMGGSSLVEDASFILTFGNLTVGDAEQTANALTVQRCVDTAPGTVGAPGTACTNFSDTGSLIGTYGAFSLTETGWTYQLNNADPDTNALDETATGDARVRDVLRLRVDDGTADATTAAGTGTSRYSMTQTEILTIAGANDLPVPVNTTTDGMVVEAGVNPANDLVTADNAAVGSVAVTDPDDAAFTYRVKHSTESSYVSAPASSSVDRDGTYGAITLNSTGAWTYTLDQMCGATAGIQGDTVDTAEAGDPGCATQMLLEASTGITDVFNIQVNDGTADGTTIADITITVDGTNDAPTLVAPPPTVTPGTVGQMYRLPLAQFFEDVDHATHRYSIQGSTCGGFKVSGTNLVGSDTTTEGAIPAGTAANSPVSCTIRAIDGEVGHVSASLSVTVNAAAAPVVPTINFKANSFPTTLTHGDDVTVTFTRTGDTSATLVVGYRVDVGTHFTSGVTTFAEDSDEAEATVDWDDDLAAGAGSEDLVVTLLAPNDIVLLFVQPRPGNYTVGSPNKMTVAIPALAANVPPVAVADPIPIGEDAVPLAVTARDMGVLANDTDDGDATMLEVVGFHQILNARATYTPGDLVTSAGMTVGIAFLGMSDPDLAFGTSVANLRLNVKGTYTLTPVNSALQHLGAGDTEVFYVRYRIEDEGGLESVVSGGLITITVNGANDAPTVVGTLPAVDSGTSGMAYSQPLAGFFEDVDRGEQATLTYALSEPCTGFVIGGTGNGFLVGSNGGSIPSTVTTDTTCMVTATDGTATSPPASLAIGFIAVTNTPPTLTLTTDVSALGLTEDDSTTSLSGTYTLTDNEQTGANAPTLQRCVDAVEGTACTVFADADISDIPGTYGDFRLVTSGNQWFYALDNTDTDTNGLDGNDSVTEVLRLRANDGTGDTSGATSQYSETRVITVTITGANDAPTFTLVNTKTAVTEAGVDGSGNAAAGDPNANGSLTGMDPDTGEAASLDYQVLDAQGNWQDGTSSGYERPGTYGTLSLMDDGSWTYALNNASAATNALDTTSTGITDSFSVRVEDAQDEAAATRMISITVNGANDAPAVDVAIVGQTATKGAAFTFTVPTNAFADPESDTLTYTHTVSPPADWLQLDEASGQFSVLNSDTTTTVSSSETKGTVYSVVVTASDSKGGMVSAAAFTITIGEGNQAPSAVADAVTATEAAVTGSGTITIMGNVVAGTLTARTGLTDNLAADTDPETDTISVTRFAVGNDITASPENAGGSVTATVMGISATMTIASTGAFTFTPPTTGTTMDSLAAGGSAAFVFTYEVNDDSGKTHAALSSNQLTITVNGANDAPAVVSSPPTPDGGTSGMDYSMDLVQFFTDPDHASLTYGIKTGTCTGFAVSGNNLVGSESDGSIPTTVIADTPCTITATDNVVATPTETSFTIGITVPSSTPTVTITGIPASLDVGDDLEFTVTASPAPVADLSVSYDYRVTTGTNTLAQRGLIITGGSTMKGTSIPWTSLTGRGLAAGGTVSIILRNPIDGSFTLGDPSTFTVSVPAPANTAPTVVSNPTVEAATYGMAYSMDLARFFNDADMDTLTFAITSCTGFALNTAGTHIVGMGTNPAGSVTVFANTTCAITATDATGSNMTVPTSFTITVTVPPAVVSLGTPLPTTYDVDGTDAIEFPLVRTGDPRSALQVDINVAIVQLDGTTARIAAYDRNTTIAMDALTGTATIPHSPTGLGAAVAGDTITLTISVPSGAGYTISGNTSFVIRTGDVTNQAPVARDDLVEISPTDLLSLNPASFESDGYLYVVTTGNRTGQRPDPLPAGADTDPDGDDTALRVTRVAAGETLGSSPTDIPGTGGVNIPGDNGAVFAVALGGFTYTPTASVLKALSPGGTLEDKFTYEISDGTDVATALYTIRITKPAAANSKPVLTRGDSDKTSVTEAGGVANATAGDPSANGAFSFLDADNDTLTLQARASANSGWTDVSENATAIPGGVYGSLSVNTNGTWTYTLDNDCSSTAGDPGCATDALNVRPPPFESDDFSFRLDDGNTDNATRYSDVLGLQVSVTGANDAPVAPSPGTPDATAVEGGSFSHTALAFTDVDNDDAKLMYTATYESGGSQVALPAWLAFDGATRQFSSTSAVGGTYNITVTASDGGLTATDEFTLTVSALPTVSISALPEVTAGDALTFTLSRTGGTAADLTVAYNIGLSTGTGGGDFTATFLATNNTVEVSSTLTTVTDQTITVKVLTTAEAATASQTVGRYNVDDTAKTRMITVSALPVVSVSGFDPTRLDAGDSLGFELSRSGGTTAALTVAYNLTLSTGTGAGAATAVIPIGANSVDVTPTLTTVAGQTITVTVLAFDDSMASSLSGVGMYALGTGDNLTRSITVNSPPTAVADRVAGTEKAGSITGDVINGSGSPLAGTDMDVDGISTLSVTRFALGDMASDLPGTNNAGMAVTGDHGSLTINANGSFTYAIDDDNNVLQVGEMNTDEFIYEISDSTLMATGTLTITINGVNNGPILVERIGNQSAVVNEMVNFSVGDDVFNDVDNDDSTLTYRITEKGLCTWLGITSTTGVFTGTPTEVPASNGRCEITVEVSDGAGGTSTDNFSLIVTAVPNVAPVAADDTNTVGENTASVSGNVISGHPTTMAGQDTDANAGQTPGVRDYAPGTDITVGNVGGVARVATGRYGTLTIAADGAYTYAVNAAANDSLVSATDTNEDVFTYEIGDGIARGVTATLTITITGVNDAPQAVSPAPIVRQGIIGAAYSLPLAQFFTDPDHATLTYGLSGTCDGFALNSAGTDLVGSESGDIPAATTAGDKTCMITATDNVVATPTSTSITIAVSTTAPPPVISITGWPDTVTAGEDTVFTVTRTGGDLTSELEWDFSYVVTPAGGNAGAAAKVYRTVTAFAIGSMTATGTLNGSGLSIAGGVGAGDTITVTLEASTDGSYTLGTGDQLTRSVVWTAPVTPGPQPVADQPTPGTATYGTAYRLSLVNYFTNPDNARLMFGITTGTCSGFVVSGTLLVGTGTNPVNSVTATVDTDCTITASDGTNPASMVSFTIPVTVPAGATNTPPTLTKTDTKVAVTEMGVDASNAAVAGDPAANGSLMATDADTGQTATLQGCADADASTACTGFRDATTAGLAITGVYGAFTLMADGAWTYMLVNTDSDTNALAAGTTATDTLRVRADDGVGNTTDMAGMGRSRHSTTLAVEVTITGTNDAPVAVAGAGGGIPDTIAATQGEVFNFMLGAASTRFTDPEGDTLSYSTLTGLPGTIAFDATTGTFSGDAPATGTPTITVTVNDGNGGEVSETFTLNLLTVPTPPSLTTAVTVMEVDPGTDPAAPTSGVAITAVDLGFNDANDSRLESVTFTVPADTVGVLYRNGVAVTTSSLTLTRAELAAANLRFVPANRKAASAPSVAFSTIGNNRGTIASSMLNYTVPASDDAPVVDADIDDPEIAEDRQFTFPIPLDAFDPVDIDDPITLAETPTQADRSPLPSWLMFTPAAAGSSGLGTFSGTPPENAPDVTVRVTVEDADGNDVFTDFTFQVTGGKPTFGISHVRHVNRELLVTVVRDDETVAVTAATVKLMIEDEAGDGKTDIDRNYVDDKVYPCPIAEGDDEEVCTVMLKRTFGPGATITVTLMEDAAYEISMNVDLRSKVMVEIADSSTLAREGYLQDGMSGLARSMGWDMAEAIRKRASFRHQGGGKQVDMSALTQRLTSKLNSRINAFGDAGGGNAGGGNEIMKIIDAMNNRSVAVDGASVNGSKSLVSGGAFAPAGGAAAFNANAISAAGQGIHPIDPHALGGGNAGTLYTGEAADARGWLLNLGAGRVTRMLDGIYRAAEDDMESWLPEDMNLWADISLSEVSFGGTGAAKSAGYTGDIRNLRLGYEKELNENLTVGLALSRIKGDIKFKDTTWNTSGNVDISTWNLNPYLLTTANSFRFWLTAGFGRGEFDYDDLHLAQRFADKADLETSMLALGTEYDLMISGGTELIGRFEVMNVDFSTDKSDGGRFDEQEISVRGARGELELALTQTIGETRMRPYLSLGYRVDHGDGSGGNAFEFGAGISLLSQNFSFDASARTQSSPSDGDYDRSSYALSFAFDTGNDKQGLMLALSQDHGMRELNPFDSHSLAVSSALTSQPGTAANFGADTMKVQAGYGFAVKSLQSVEDIQEKSGILTLRNATDFNQGVMSRSEIGLMLELYGSDDMERRLTPDIYELLFSRDWNEKTDRLASEDAILLRFSRQF